MVWLYYNLFSCSTIDEHLGYFQFYVDTNIVDKNVLTHIYLCAGSLISMGTTSTPSYFP